MPLNLKSTSGGGITLAAAPTAVDLTVTVPATNGTLVTTGGLSDGSGASLVGYLPAGTGAVPTDVQTKLRESVSVKDFGAVGDGVTDDTAAIQLALDSLSNGGTINLENGKQYAIAYTSGTNDKWGLKITASNITVKGNGATLLRKDSIVTNGYPLIFVGTPDSNVAAATKNVTIEGVIFEGNDTRHAVTGSAPNDFRSAIYAKNTVNLCVEKNTFTEVDSSVIYFQRPVSLSGASYYNTTNNYNAKFVKNTCTANAHATVGRSLIHAVIAIGVDDILVDGNTFYWCDDAVISDSTYDVGTVQGSTYTTTTAGWVLGDVVRSGRGCVVTNNMIINSSEHPIYLTGMNEIVANNTVISDSPTITATNDAIKIRSYGCTVSGNVVSGYGSGISVSAGALNVSVTGNNVYVPAEANFGLAAISVSSTGISSYVAGRIAQGFWSVYRPMTGISFAGNTINFPTTAAATTRLHMGFSILSETTDANYPNGQIAGIAINGNSVSNHQVGVHVVGLLYRNAVVSGNSFFGKPFTEAAFSTATTMNTRCVVQSMRGSSADLNNLIATDNTVYGTKYLWASFDGAGAAASFYPPAKFDNNSLKFVQFTGTADFVNAGSSVRASFKHNFGALFLPRTWGGLAINNHLFTDDVATDVQALKQSLGYLGGVVRFYTDDIGTFLTL